MNKKILTKILPITLTIFVAGSLIAWTNAQAAATSTGSRNTQRMERLVSRADQEIARRIGALEKLESRINGMNKLSDSDKSSLNSTVQGQIDELNSLKSKIDSDTDLTVLLSDVKSIVTSYRIYVLVIPEGAIMASADRILSIADTMSAIGTKFQSRISQGQSSGKDVSSLQSLLSDFGAKIAAAKTQAQNAVTEVSSLKPDQGDKTVLQSNTQALKDARSKIHAAQQDFVAARKDAAQILRGLAVLNRGMEATSTSGSATSSE